MTADTGALAGVFSRREPPAKHIAGLRRALSGDGPAATELWGSLAIAWTSRRPARDGPRRCALAGRLYGRGEGEAEAAVLSAWARGGDPPAWLRGDFVLVLWDEAAGSGLLARDQMGQRGLFFHDDGAVLRFATEVHLLLAILPRRPGPDLGGLAHWLSISGLPGETTLYAGVRRLPAGHLVALDERPGRSRAWWSPRFAGLLREDAPAIAERLRGALRLAVERRSGDGEQVGVLLSGGLDSSSVAGFATGLAPQRRVRRAYSATFPDHPSVDEGDLIALLAQRLGLSSTRLAVRSGSVLAGALPYLEHWQVPPVSPNLFFWAPLLRQARAEGIRVMLDGEGGDEMFGLSAYLAADRLARGRVGEAVALSARVPGAGGRLTWRQARFFLWRFAVRGASPTFMHTVSRSLRPPGAYVPPWLRPEAARAFVAIADGGEWKRRRGPRWWRWLVWATASGMGPALLYDHVRHRAAMAGLEPRHPLVDVDVLELMLRVPPELSFHPDLSRPLLRDATAGLLPDEVRLRRSKSSFDSIFHDSLAGPDLPLARRFLGADARVGAYADLGRVGSELLDRAPPAGGQRQRWALHVWRLLTAECWLRAQEDPSAPRRVAEEVGLPAPECSLEPAGARGPA